MTGPVCACGAPVRDAFICAGCAHRIDDALAALTEHHGLAWDLDIALTRQARIVRRAGRPTVENREDERQHPGTLRPTPTPYEERAAEAAEQLRAALTRWSQTAAHGLGIYADTNRPGIGPTCRSCNHASCRTLRPVPAPPTDLPGMAAWLRPRVGWLRHHPDATTAHNNIVDAVRAVRRAIDRPAELLYAGPCDECGEDMYARPKATCVECSGCDLVYEVEARRQWLLRAAEDVLATGPEIARAITSLGQPVTDTMIRGYAHRGRLLRRGTRQVGGRAVPIYRLGDVLEVLTQIANRDGTMSA